MVLGGYERIGNQTFNATILIASDGTLRGKYHKVNLWKEQGTSPGKREGLKHPIMFQVKLGGIVVKFGKFILIWKIIF